MRRLPPRIINHHYRNHVCLPEAETARGEALLPLDPVIYRLGAAWPVGAGRGPPCIWPSMRLDIILRLKREIMTMKAQLGSKLKAHSV